jgi:hypothetical protein
MIRVFITLLLISGHVMILGNVKLGIERAIKKSPHNDLAGNLFNADHAIDKHLFVGFVSSHAKSNVLTSFHLHSFVTFYTDSDSNTVVTCTLTTRHHILSNMQDCLMQLLQLTHILLIMVIGVCLVLINKAVTYYYKFYTNLTNQRRNLV